MIGVLMILYSAAGFLAHQTRQWTTDHMSVGWRDISNYGLGVMYVFPLGTWMFITLKDDIKRPHVRFMVSYLLSFLSFGMGVIAGFRYEK